MSNELEKVRETLASPEDISPAEGLNAPEGYFDPSGASDPPRTPPFSSSDDSDGSDPLIPKLQECVAFPLNDIGNGKRFVTHFGEDVISVPRVAWFVWTGQAWKRDDDRLDVRAKAQEISALIEREIPHLRMLDWQMDLLAQSDDVRQSLNTLLSVAETDRTDSQKTDIRDLKVRLSLIEGMQKSLSDLKGSHKRHSKNAGNSGPIDNMMKEGAIARSKPLCALDANPLDINIENGVLRFSVSGGPEEGFSRTSHFELVPHDRADLLTKMMPVGFDPDAQCPNFDAFLERVQPDRDVRMFIQRWFGLSMTSLTGDQKLAFFYGAGANGKSVLVDLMARIMGDYAATAKIESITGSNRRGGGDATPDLIPLMGARMVRASEPEQGERLQEAVIKAITGGEPMQVRALHSDFVEFLPKFKLTISGNYKPEIRGTDDGIWRRVLLTPFDVQIPIEERDHKLGEKLWAERAGILNWMIRGLVDYLEGGLAEPDIILNATQEYRAESDPVGTFLSECCLVTGQETEFTTSKDLIEAFNFWLDEKGETKWGGRTVSLRLKDKAGKWRDAVSGKKFAAAKVGVTGYRGICLNDMFKARFNSRSQGRTDAGWDSGRDGF